MLRVDRTCHIGRTYEDYQAYMSQNPDALVSQMDSVVLHKGGQVILTILFTTCDLQLMFLREGIRRQVWRKFLGSCAKSLGQPAFSMLFQVLLTDRGQ